MSNTKHTPGPWTWEVDEPNARQSTPQIGIFQEKGGRIICEIDSHVDHSREEIIANAELIASAPTIYQQNSSLLEALKEMKRYLPVLERLEEIPEWWEHLTKGTGIATLNGYKNAIQNAENK